jgi:murein DD-endopeptidase MepM/ murein hydrolase activator NlpD
VSPEPLWQDAFQEPVNDYLEISSTFGARRSTNGGPYNRYHEGVDFSAYGGTPVLAPAGGVVVVAEPLYVRGGAVIIDHGLGVYSGYYHLSEVLVEAGTAVSPGDPIGAVGTTGLSTGNHLHWDLLIGTTWVDAAAWLEQDMACWILDGWGQPCADSNSG